MHDHKQNSGRQLQLRNPDRREQQGAAGDADTAGTRSETAHAVDLVHGQRERFCDGFDRLEQRRNPIIKTIAPSMPKNDKRLP